MSSQRQLATLPPTTKELLLLTHMHYDAGARSLKDQALADIITKALFGEPGKKLSQSQIQGRVASILGVSRITDEQINAGIAVLKQAGVVAHQESKWVLKPHEVNRIKEDYQLSQRQTSNILSKYFSVPVENDRLRKWFLAAGAAFFGRYGDLSARLLCRQEPIKLSTKEILDEALCESIKEHGLLEHELRLTEGFKAFLADYKNPTVNQQIWTFAQAMLAARIITASIGPDPITLERFKGAELYLDTNILFIAALEGGALASAFEDFAKSLHHIGATLHIISDTEDEYKRVVQSKQETIMSVRNSFTPALLEKSNDLFWKTARSRGCDSVESFDIFFNQVKNTPLNTLPGVTINLNKDNTVIQTALAGTKNQKLLTDISDAWQRHRGNEKRNARLAHDAALAAVCTQLRKDGKNSWVITADRSMQLLAADWAGKTGMPEWISLDSLIQIMAIAGPGPGHDPRNFGPILAALIDAEINPSENAFRLEDLSDLLEQEDQLKDLPESKAEEFATQATRNRLSGLSNDILVRDIRRAIQVRKMDENVQLRDLQSRANSAEQESMQALSDKEQARRVLVKVLIPQYVWRLRLKASVWAIAGAGAAIATWLIAIGLDTGHPQWAAFIRLLIIPEIGAPFWQTFKRLEAIQAEVERRAIKKAGELLS